MIEDVAGGSSHSELEVAREAINLAQTAAELLSTKDRTAHVGYYLIDHGRHILERAVGCHLSWKLRFRAREKITLQS